MLNLATLRQHNQPYIFLQINKYIYIYVVNCYHQAYVYLITKENQTGFWIDHNLTSALPVHDLK